MPFLRALPIGIHNDPFLFQVDWPIGMQLDPVLTIVGRSETNDPFLRSLTGRNPTVHFVRWLGDRNPTILSYDRWPIQRSRYYDRWPGWKSKGPMFTIIGRPESHDTVLTTVARSESNDPIQLSVGRSESKHLNFSIDDRSKSSD